MTATTTSRGEGVAKDAEMVVVLQKAVASTIPMVRTNDGLSYGIATMSSTSPLNATISFSGVLHTLLEGV